MMCIFSPRNIHPKTHMEPKGPQTARGINPPGAEMDASPPPRSLAGRDLGRGHRDKGADAGGTGPRGEGSRTGSQVCGRGLTSTDVSSAGGAALPNTLQVLTPPAPGSCPHPILTGGARPPDPHKEEDGPGSGGGGAGRGVTPSAPRSSRSPGALTRVPARPCATACACVCVSACEPTCRTRVPRVHSRVGKPASLGVPGGEEADGVPAGLGWKRPIQVGEGSAR